MSTPSARNPRADASERLGTGRIGLVLEPSRPAVHDGPWFADDPLRVAANGAVVVSPVTVGEGSWDDAISMVMHSSARLPVSIGSPT